jgi:hypothetical protein
VDKYRDTPTTTSSSGKSGRLRSLRRGKRRRRRAWRTAREKFKDVTSAEKRYKKDLEAEIYEVHMGYPQDA